MFFAPIATASAPLAQGQTPMYVAPTTQELIKEYAGKYNVSYTRLRNTLKCESGFNPKAWNKADPNGGSKGIAQFQPATFATYSKLAGIENGDVWDREDSIQTAAYMFSKGQEMQWSCFAMLYGNKSS